MTKCKINNEEMIVKGIDEIPMFSWNTKTKEFYVLSHKFDGVNSIEEFVNYIHSLDKKNKQLKEDLKAVNKGLRKTQERRNKYKRKYLKERWINNQLKQWLKDELKRVRLDDIQVLEIYIKTILSKIEELEKGISNE